MKNFLLTIALLMSCTAAFGQAPPIATTTTMNLPGPITQGDTSFLDIVTVASADGLGARGTVQITFSGFGTFTHTLTNGSTNYTLYSLPIGTYQVQASYPAQGLYAASTSTVQTLTVVPDTRIHTSVGFAFPPTDIIQGDRVSLFTVVVRAEDNSVLNDDVQLSFSNFGTFTHTLVPGIEATINGPINYSLTHYTLYSLPVGTYQVQAIFPEQGQYAASKTWITQTLNVHPRP